MSPFIRPPSLRHADRVLGRSVLLLTLALYSFTAQGPPIDPAQEALFQSVSALCRTGSTALGGTEEAQALIVGHADGRARVRPGAGPGEGSYFAETPPGAVLAGVPFYFAGRLLGLLLSDVEERHRTSPVDDVHRSEYFEHLLFGMRNALFGALTCWVLVLACRRVGVSRLGAWLAGLSYGVATFAWPFARSGGEEVLATLMLALAFQAGLRLEEAFQRLRSPSLARFAGLGTAFGAAVLVSPAAWLPVVVLDVWVLSILRHGCSRLHEWRASAGLVRAPGFFARELCVLIPQVLALGIALSFNAVRFGHALDAGAAGFPTAVDLAEGARSLASQLVSPGDGLLWLAPTVLFAPLALRGSKRLPWKPVAWVAAAVAAAVVIGLTPDRETFGPESLLPLLPFLWIVVGGAIDEADSGFLRFLLGLTLAFGVIEVVPATLVDSATYEDLLQQRARAAATEAQPAEARVRQAPWSLRQAAPWAHWRILRHRAAGLTEEFPEREVFLAKGDHRGRPVAERARGFSHLAWVDWSRRLGKPLWPMALVVFGLGAFGIALSIRSLDRSF